MERVFTDEELYQSYLLGNQDSFDQLIINNRTFIIRCVQKYIQDYFIAEDICQEILIYISGNKENYNSKYSFKTYLRMLAKYQSLDFIRKNKDVNIVSIDDHEESIYDSPMEDRILNGIELEEKLKLLRMLKKDFLEVILLIEVEKMSYSKAAATMHTNVNHVRILLHRARKRIKFIIESKGDEDEKRPGISG